MFGAPAAGGFGKAPAAAGGFGAAPAPAAGGFGAAAPAAGGFGKAPAAAGGFGAPAAAPAAGGFGAPAAAAPAAGGFGAAPAAAPAAGGFGAAAPAAGGFGKAPAAAGGFGAPAAGGFGAPAAGGFGAKAPGGFGAPAGGFGAAPAPAPVAAIYNPDLNVADLSRQATIGRYIMQMDKAYDATGPDCKFRTFVFNMCPPGTSTRNERYAYDVLGEGFPERQWIDASRENPDPDHMSPTPLHYMAGLLERTDKQVEMTKLLHKKRAAVAAKAEELQQLNAENNNTYRRLVEKSVMLERQALLTQSKVETLRQRNLPLGEEKHKIADRAAWLKSQLDAPGSFKATLAEIEPFIGGGAIATSSSSVDGKGNNSSASNSASVDPSVLATWSRFLLQMEAGISRLQETVAADKADIEQMHSYEENGRRRA